MSDEGTRPWGRYEILGESEAYKTKVITVLPGQRLSYQKHAKRSEHWFVVSGIGEVLLDGQTTALSGGSAVDVPVGVAHRITNTGREDLVFIEVQHGESFGEDDIVRLEDDYGR